MNSPAHDVHLLIGLRNIANLVLIGGFALALAAEIIFPNQEGGWSLQRAGRGVHNLVLWIIGVAVMSLVFGGTTWYSLQWMQHHSIGVLYLLPLSPWWHAAVAFVLFDATDYFFHRLSHNVRWLWLLHAVHHSDTQMNVTTNLRQHPLHIVFTQLWKLVACAAIGLPAWAFLVHEIMVIGFAHAHHAAVRWPRWVDRTFSWLLITPHAHWNHHSPQMAKTNSNYGVIFSAWDRCFGTWTSPGSSIPEFGLNALRKPFWHNAWGMLATPWRARSLRQM